MKGKGVRHVIASRLPLWLNIGRIMLSLLGGSVVMGAWKPFAVRRYSSMRAGEGREKSTQMSVPFAW